MTAFMGCVCRCCCFAASVCVSVHLGCTTSPPPSGGRAQLSFPPGFEDRLLAAVRCAREVELGLIPGSLSGGPAASFVEKRTLHVSLHNGHAYVESLALAVKTPTTKVARAQLRMDRRRGPPAARRS